MDVFLRDEVWDTHSDGHGVGKTHEDGSGPDGRLSTAPAALGMWCAVPAGSH